MLTFGILAAWLQQLGVTPTVIACLLGIGMLALAVTIFKPRTRHADNPDGQSNSREPTPERTSGKSAGA